MIEGLLYIADFLFFASRGGQFLPTCTHFWTQF